MKLWCKQRRDRLRKIFFAGVVALFGAGSVHAQTLVIPDTGGYDQIDQGMGAQQDIAGVTFNGNVIDFAWDEPSLSGSNSSDVCSYFLNPDDDPNNPQKVTSICYSVTFVDPAVPTYEIEYEVYTCDGTYGNGKCTGNNPVSSDYDAVCDEDPVLVSPYFPQDPDQDLQASCTITGLNGNDPADLLYINTCTKPSASPSSLSNDCIFDPGEPDPGFLELEKVVLDGTAIATDFTLTATGSVDTLTGQGSTALTPLTGGDYTLTESSSLLDDGSYQLVDIMCTDYSGKVVPVDASNTITLPSLTQVSCVYTNEVAFVETAEIAIDKTPDTQEVDPGSNAVFTLAVSVGNGNVALSNVTVTDSQCDSPPAFQSGDSNGDNVLDIDETWIYNCTVSNITADFTNTATASGTSPAGTDVQADDMADVTVLAAELSIDKPAPVNADDDGSGDVSVGDTLTYTITATNSGDATLTNVVVSDGLITPTGGTTPCVSVASGATCTLIGTYVVTEADVTAGQVFNTATADSDQTGEVSDDETVPVLTPSLAIDKPAPANADEDGSGDVSLGDTLTYTITATNDGATNLTDVVVSDGLITATGGTTPCALVAPGGTCTLVGTYKVTQTDVTAGQVLNTATADSDQTDEVTDDETVTVPTPSLAIDKPAPVNADEDGSGDISLGDTLTYTITATNDGDANLTDVVVSDGMITATGGTTPCALVVPGATCTLVGTYVITQADVTAGQVLNTATANSDQTDEVTDDETVTVPTPSLAIDKPAPVNADEDGSGDVSLGDTLTYTITATNDGDANLTDVVVSDGLITATGGTTPCALVVPGSTCTLVGTYVVTQADVTTGQIFNTATADSDQTDQVTDTETVPVPTPSLAIDKPAPVNADEDGSGDVSLGDTLTYTITATNDGTANLTNVVVSDGLITATGGTTPCALVVPGATCTLVGTYIVTEADLANGQVLNTATANSNQTDPVTDTENVPVPVPELSLAKSGVFNDENGDTFANAGTETISYSFVVASTGTANLTNVSVSDPLPGLSAISCPSGNPIPFLAAGTQETCTATYTITQEDVDAGIRENLATADSTQTGPEDSPASVDLPQNPDHSLEKDFLEDPVDIGSDGSFTLTYTNTGNITLNDINIADQVAPILDVNTVAIDVGSCAPASQTVACSVDTLAPGESAVVTVDYTAAPDLPMTNQTSGASYVFYFANGYVLTGSTADGTATLTDPNGVETPADVGGANQDVVFNAPDGQTFTMHLSCSEPFVNGYGITGPTEADNPEWQISNYSVDRYNSQGFLKSCGQTFIPLFVDNTASAQATPVAGVLDPNPIEASDSVELLQESPIEISRTRVRRGQVELQYFNTSQEAVEIDIIGVTWTDGAVLESASYQDGIDLGLAGGSPQSADISNTLGARSKDWLRLNFNPNGAPDGLVITIVTTDGSTLTYEF